MASSLYIFHFDLHSSSPRTVTTLAVLLSASLGIFLWFNRRHKRRPSPIQSQKAPVQPDADSVPTVSTETAAGATFPKPLKKLTKAQLTKKEAKAKRRQARKEAEAAAALLNATPVIEEESLEDDDEPTAAAETPELTILEVTPLRDEQAHGPGGDCVLPRSPRASSPSPSETTTSTNTTALTLQSSTLILTPPSNSSPVPDVEEEEREDTTSIPGEAVAVEVSSQGGDDSPDTILGDPLMMKEPLPEQEEVTIARASSIKRAQESDSVPVEDAQKKISPNRTASAPSTPPVASIAVLSSAPSSLTRLGRTRDGTTSKANCNRAGPDQAAFSPKPKPRRSVSSQGSSGGVVLGLPSSASAGTSSRPSSSGSTFSAPRHIRRQNHEHQQQPGGHPRSPVVGRNGPFSPVMGGPTSPVHNNGMQPFFGRPPVSWNVLYGSRPPPPPLSQQAAPLSPSGQPSPMFQTYPAIYSPHAFPPIPLYATANGSQSNASGSRPESRASNDDGTRPGTARGPSGGAGEGLQCGESSEDEDDVILVSVDDNRRDRRDDDEDMIVDFPTLNPVQPGSRPVSTILNDDYVVPEEKSGGTFSRGREAHGEDGSDMPEATENSSPSRSDGAQDGYTRSESRSSQSSSSVSSFAPSTKHSSFTPQTGNSANPSPRMSLKHLHPLNVPTQPPPPHVHMFTPYSGGPPPGYSPMHLPSSHPSYMRSTSTPSPVPAMPPAWWPGPNPPPPNGFHYPPVGFVGPPPEHVNGAFKGDSAADINSGPRSRSTSPFAHGPPPPPPPPPMPISPMGYLPHPFHPGQPMMAYGPYGSMLPPPPHQPPHLHPHPHHMMGPSPVAPVPMHPRPCVASPPPVISLDKDAPSTSPTQELEKPPLEVVDEKTPSCSGPLHANAVHVS